MAPMMKKFNLNPDDARCSLQPLNEIVFSKYNGDVHRKKSKTLLTTLQVVAVVILLIAWINYLNMVIYANGKRMKELGVRKNSGARSVDFILQFTIESGLINFIGVLGALTLVQFSKGPLRDYMQIDVSFAAGINISLIILVVVAILGIVITGVYPALDVLQKTTSRVLRIRDHRQDSFLGGGLTVFQFVTAIVLIIGIFVVHSQLRFVLDKDLGIKRDEVVVIDLPASDKDYQPSTITTFLDKLSTLKNVTGVAVSSSVPGDNEQNGIGLQRVEGAPFLGIATDGGVDERFLPFYNLRLLAGRNFTNGDPINEQAVIISRKVMERLEFSEPEQAIGQTILAETKAWTHDMKPVIIIGVIEDYNRNPLTVGSESYWSDDTGIALTYFNHVDAENIPKKISLTLNTGDFQNGIDVVQREFQQFFPKDFFHWYFLNDNINQHYEDDRYARNQVTVFTVVAIGIACLGLLGMISNRAEEKIKEIGIRKVLGAELGQIMRILLRPTIRQIVMAALIAIPSSIYLSGQYLQSFSERIALQWWHFTLPVAILVFIMFCTVISVVWKAAQNNPVEALKHE
jgi:putative ABC transport system permease protein